MQFFQSKLMERQRMLKTQALAFQAMRPIDLFGYDWITGHYQKACIQSKSLQQHVHHHRFLMRLAGPITARSILRRVRDH